MKQAKTIIIGLGQTGISVARFLKTQGIEFSVCDTREQISNLAEFQTEFPNVAVHLGALDPERLISATQLIVSPGVAITIPAIAAAKAAGVEVIGDIELFLRHCTAPIIAITGSNGKTTVTTLVGEMATTSGLRVGIGGNIGIPVLDLLNRNYNFFVLELSSFQLETTSSLKAAAAVCLNVSDNHMDRYHAFQDYVAAKNRIYQHALVSVINLDDPRSWETAKLSTQKIGFTVQNAIIPEGVEHYFSLINYQLCYDGEAWLAISDLPIKTKHHCANLLAAFALGYSCGLKKEAMLSVAKSFEGIPHRCQTVAEKQGVLWINDSKATTIAAATVAIENIGETLLGKIILIAGGDGKGANFTPFAKPISEYCREVILLGRDAEQIAAVLPDSIKPIFVKTLADAVTTAAHLAQQGDAVLLSPACASTDMFKNFVERGELFIKYVNENL